MALRGRSFFTAAACIALSGGLAACASSNDQAQAQSGGFQIPFFGGGDNQQAEDESQIGVNSFLWRASLDTLNFMPLASADPFGGVIITDWYSDPARPDERFKATVYILDTRLRADALNVTVTRETRAAGGWQAAAVSADTSTQIENAILTRARQLRLSTLRD